MHEKKFAHLDIKTDILILANGTAVVADFGTISLSEVPTSKYVSLIPYRPPETYAEDDNWAPVNGEMYNTWIVGLMCLRVFTREHYQANYQALQDHKNFWAKKMYPVLYDILQKKNFSAKIKVCFPRSQNCLSKADDVLNLIKACLHLDPKKRVTMKEALRQRLFGAPLCFELEQRSPWDDRAVTEEIESLLLGLKIQQAEKSLDNAIVKKKEADVEDEIMIMKNVGDEEKIESTKKVEEKICNDGDKIFFQRNSS